MPVPTDEQIEKWRERWTKSNTLPNVIAWILARDVVDRPPVNAAEAEARMWRVNDVLRNGEFDVYEGGGKEAVIKGELARVPVLDLRGVCWNDQLLVGVELPIALLEGACFFRADLGGADLAQAHLEGADLGMVHLEAADLVGAHLNETRLGNAHLEGAILMGADLEEADLRGAHFEGAVLSVANLRGANLCSARFGGAFLGGTHLEAAHLDHVSVGRVSAFSSDCHLNAGRKLMLGERKTQFFSTEYLPKWQDFFPIKFSLKNVSGFLKGIRLRDWWKFSTERWFYTDFLGVRIDDADTVQAADLKRYVNDQQFLLRFKARHPIGYKLWKWLTGCGDNLWFLAFWSLLVVLAFAVVYSMPWQLVSPDQIIREDFTGPDWVKWPLVSFDIFTNLGIRTAHPHTTAGAFAVIIETLFGYVSLGLFIAVATNKFVRRA